MKVLSERKPWSKRTKCQHCGTRVELNASDITFVSDWRDGDAITYRCPGCSETVWLSAANVPAHVLRKEAGR